MDRDLTPAQRYELIDFLKRWGIDHPELLAEMTDHYSEKAIDAMDSGKSWTQILDSWKTKETFRALRKIQHDYENVFPKRIRREQWAFVKSTLCTIKGLSLIAVLLLVLLAIGSIPLGAIVLHKALTLYAFISVGIMVYVSLNKRKRKILNFRSFGFYYTYNVILWQVGFGKYLSFTNPEWAIQPATILDTLALWFGIVLTGMTYKLWQRTQAETAHLTDQMLKEHENPRTT